MSCALEDFCHHPLVVRTTGRILGELFTHLTVHSEKPGDNVNVEDTRTGKWQSQIDGEPDAGGDRPARNGRAWFIGG
jgi:hypothetical protein